MNGPNPSKEPRERAPRMGMRLLLLALAAVVIIYLLIQITAYEGGRRVHSAPPSGTPPAGSSQGSH